MNITKKYRENVVNTYPIGTTLSGKFTDGTHHKIKIEANTGVYNDRGCVRLRVLSLTNKKFYLVDAEGLKSRFTTIKLGKNPIDQKDIPISKKDIKKLTPKVRDIIHSIVDYHPSFYKVVKVMPNYLDVISIRKIMTSGDKYNSYGTQIPVLDSDLPDECNAWADSSKWVGHNPANEKNGTIRCKWKVERLGQGDNEPYTSIYNKAFTATKWSGKPIAWSSCD